MARFAVVCAAVTALALAGCAKEPSEQEAPVNDAAVPPPPLTTEMVGGSDPAVQPPVAPTQAPDTTPAATTAPAAAPATPAPATADTSHAAHADSGHTSH